MAQATFSCPFGAIHLEMPWGLIPVSAFAERALIGAVPRRSLVLSIAGKNARIFPDALRASFTPLIHRKDWNKPC